MASADKTDIEGIVTRAMAIRVKYRRMDKDAFILRPTVPVACLGVHPKNRGGVYPAGIRCKSLLKEVLEGGFSKEDVNHACVAVEEVPIADIRSRGENYESGLAFNTRKVAADELLSTCFDAPYNDVRYMQLAHNHMMLNLRAWQTRAKWDMKADEKRGITYCDDKGRLSVTAVAENKHGKELAELLTEGKLLEVLSWRMDLEEPTAASTISRALNNGHQVALRTAELTAVAV